MVHGPQLFRSGLSPKSRDYTYGWINRVEYLSPAPVRHYAAVAGGLRAGHNIYRQECSLNESDIGIGQPLI